MKKRPTVPVKRLRFLWATEISIKPIFRSTAGHDLFPFSFLLDGVINLLSQGIVRKGKRARKRVELIFFERSALFLKVLNTVKSISPFPESHNGEDEGFCLRCGKCCFIASGYPDFPEKWPLPEKWKSWFAQGCGYGQVFCAFLFEEGNTGRAFCAIYPYRPGVCRLFGKEECEYLHEERAFEDQKGRFLLMRRLVAMLRNRGPFEKGGDGEVHL